MLRSAPISSAEALQALETPEMDQQEPLSEEEAEARTAWNDRKQWCIWFKLSDG